MMRRSRFVPWLWALGALVLLTASPAGSQEAASTVNIVQSVGPPDGEVAVPIHVSTAEGSPIGRFTLRLQFSTNQLTFRKVEMGALADGVGAEVSTGTRERGGETFLEVVIGTPVKQGARLPLPDGPVAQLMFTIAKEMKPKAVIPLKVDVAIAGTTAGAKPVQAAGRDGQVIVSNPAMAIIGCFFYMH